MKTTRTVALAFSLLLVCTHAADVRNVGGVTVNLDPIHRWMATRQGNRPMPHWRDLTPVDYLGVINGGHAFRVVVATDGDPAPRLVVGIEGDGASRAVVKIDGDRGARVASSETKEILLKTPPPTMLRLGLRVHDLKLRLGRVESTALAAQRGAAIAAANASTANVLSYRDRRYASPAQAGYVAKVRAETVLKLTTMEREALEKELGRCLPQFRETHELAMFTGQIIDGREVWDCGVRTP
jgi:hypothetical protein